MDGSALIWLLIVGAVAGWLAGVIIRGFGFGLIGNIIVGIVGGYLGAGFWVQYWAQVHLKRATERSTTF